MNLQVARGLFFLAALGVATVAAAAWEQPRSGVIGTEHGEGNCALPKPARPPISAHPDREFMLLMLGLSQGVRSQG
ncbi:hypothetical protein [Pseudomonas sp. nanlin1]|uniref:hypothetical protein n=1 Tax=Pseudomonas sp. nanlin1 TaxID=3040605 RepID=UPI00388D1C00